MAAPFISELQALASRFCRLDFADDQTREQLADPASLLNADRVDATHENLHFSESFLTTLHFAWRAPLRLRVAELEQALGDYCVNQFGMTQETSYVFSVQRQPLVGFISLTAESAERHGRIDVREVSLRRIAPEPYMIQQGRAIRLVVLADFFAGEEGPGDPLAIGIGEGVDVDEAMARLLPAVHCDVLNYVDPDQKTLHLHFSPTTLADFEIDRLPRSVPELSALLELRRAVDSWAKANASSVQVAEAAAGDSLAPGWQNRADALTSAGKQHAGPFIAEIDRTLGNQCEAILSHPQFKALQSAWMGLDYLTRQIDFSTLSQIDVFSCPRETMVDTFRRGVVEPEVHHREGLPPALVVVDAEFSATDAAKVQELAQLAAAAEIPLVLGGFTDGHSPPRPLIRPDGAAPFVATVPTRIRLREALPNRPPRRFAYSPGRLAPETAVWASGVWAFAAAAAQSIGNRDLSGAAAALPGTARRPFKAAEVHRRAPTPASTTPSGISEWNIKFDEPSQRFMVHPSGGISEAAFSRQLALGPILHTIYRLCHQQAHRTDRDEVLRMIADALQARLPDGDVQVAFDGPPGRARLRVNVTPPYPIAGEHRQHTFEFPWHAS